VGENASERMDTTSWDAEWLLDFDDAWLRFRMVEGIGCTLDDAGGGGIRADSSCEF